MCLSRFILLICLVLVAPAISADVGILRTNYVLPKTCPDFNKIVREAVLTKQAQQPTTVAGIRLFFHDCFLEGCDASVLIATNSFNKAERDGDLNDSLPVVAFDIVNRIKTALELSCPGVVSCADILAQATHDLVTMVGRPYFDVKLGRKDGLESKAHKVKGNVPMPNQTVHDIHDMFKKNGFSLREMVALSGAHTIGFSHCKEFSDRLYGSKSDPDINPRFATALKELCKNHTVDDTIAAFNDVMTPGKFDNMYFKNLKRGLGLLASDHLLIKNNSTKPFVELYATNEKAFFEDFTRAMEKMGTVGVKGDGEGEVRRRCDHFNNLNVKQKKHA